MSEKLIIRNFGPIKNVELDLRRVNVLVGDQGTGKSTVAKVFSMIKNYVEIINLNQENPELEKNEEWQFNKYLKLFEIENYLTLKSEIIYTNEITNQKVIFINQKVIINFTRKLIFPAVFNYITAERVFVSTLADAFFGLNQFGTKLPTLFNRFGNKYSTSRKEKNKRIYNEILKVDFGHLNGIDFVIMPDGQQILLTEASSGLQGAIPMLVVFDGIVESINKADISQSNKENLLVIEEPELNLFPETQKKVVDYIVGNNFDIPNIKKLDNLHSENNKNYKNQLIITTHSPYILTSLNNLMYAHEVGKIYSEEVEKVIDRKYWLNPNDVSAYEMKIDGSCEDIFNREENLISAGRIDKISNTLNEQFEALLNIELIPR